ncbi:MAG: aldolase catalytic domain-containing protein [Lachnospiraceae bacterium]|nr:aldolase catalytic domain-containing protein [Lachnospiraceae bacterium]
MNNYNLKLLDCTLRDGGYVNEWKWGFQRARDIINALVKADVDIVEVGFLRDAHGYNPDITVCNSIEELNRLLPADKKNTMFSAMAMRSNYDINKLSPYSGEGIEMIRITAHDYDIAEGMEFARAVKAKGYKLSINPINIMGYNDEQLLWILKQVNEIQPYQFSIVDTFGSMKRRDLDRIVSLVDNNLDKHIRVALHLHENMSLSCSLAQNFIDKHLNRPVAVDASLMGMGRIPGNLPIELIADYLNDYGEKHYDIDYLMDAIQDYVAPLKGETAWGYTPAYFLSARFNLHRNYAEHYLKKGDLTNRDINLILARFDRTKANAFDAEYADEMYASYKNNIIDDAAARKILGDELQGRRILVLAPGASLKSKKTVIDSYIAKEKPIVIAVNFVPEDYDIHYAFFSNNRRLNRIEELNCKVIATSNLPKENIDYRINYNSLSASAAQGHNSLIMLLKLFRELKINEAAIAGADGFDVGTNNYFDEIFENRNKFDGKYNYEVAKEIKALGVAVEYVTSSAYDL